MSLIQGIRDESTTSLERIKVFFFFNRGWMRGALVGDNSLSSQNKLWRIKRKFHPQLAVREIGPHINIQCIRSSQTTHWEFLWGFLMGLGPLTVGPRAAACPRHPFFTYFLLLRREGSHWPTRRFIKSFVVALHMTDAHFCGDDTIYTL